MRDGNELERLTGEISREDVEQAFATLRDAEGGEAA
jgi:hypothetical protein